MKMTENFDEINAPQFVDFSECRDDEVDDTYFDNYTEEVTLVSEDPLGGNSNNDNGQFFKEFDETNGSLNEEYYEEQISPPFRRSMSVGDLLYLQNALEHARLGESEDTRDQVQNSTKADNISCGQNIKRKTASCSTERLGAVPKRSISKESLNRLAQPKRNFTSDQSLNRPYVAMAEAVKRFQQGTPERFRSKPKLESTQCGQLGRTIPHSPKLICNKRNRPVYAVSHEEKERQDFEEAQKFKIKARPVNKKVLQGPVKPTVPMGRKLTTVPEPFHLTEVHPRRKESPKRESYEFHAKPVPEFSKTNIVKFPIANNNKTLTKPQTPNVLRRYQRVLQLKAQSATETKDLPKQQPKKVTSTVPLPFSFEARNAYMKKKKEEFIRKVYEEEKKAREFHAKPIPKAVLQALKPKNGSFDSASNKNNEARRNSTKSEENLSTEFKAKPPTVLYKKPFEPIRGDKPLTEISEFKLNTDQRAKEREHFERLLKEREERVALAKETEEQLRLKHEQEEIIQIRKMTEHKAQPIRKYKEITIQPSGKVTEPVSPKFHSKKKHNSMEFNKENSQ